MRLRDRPGYTCWLFLWWVIFPLMYVPLALVCLTIGKFPDDEPPNADHGPWQVRYFRAKKRRAEARLARRKQTLAMRAQVETITAEIDALDAPRPGAGGLSL